MCKSKNMFCYFIIIKIRFSFLLIFLISFHFYSFFFILILVEALLIMFIIFVILHCALRSRFFSNARLGQNITYKSFIKIFVGLIYFCMLSFTMFVVS